MMLLEPNVLSYGRTQCGLHVVKGALASAGHETFVLAVESTDTPHVMLVFQCCPLCGLQTLALLVTSRKRLAFFLWASIPFRERGDSGWTPLKVVNYIR